MKVLFAELVPLALSGAFIPFPILVTSIHLASKNPIVNAFSFILGYHAFRFLLGFLALTLIRAWLVPVAEPSSVGSVFRALLGLILLLLAVGSLLKPSSADALFKKPAHQGSGFQCPHVVRDRLRASGPRPGPGERQESGGLRRRTPRNPWSPARLRVGHGCAVRLSRHHVHRTPATDRFFRGP